jgi:hypothetical protein
MTKDNQTAEQIVDISSARARLRNLDFRRAEQHEADFTRVWIGTLLDTIERLQSRVKGLESIITSHDGELKEHFENVREIRNSRAGPPPESSRVERALRNLLRHCDANPEGETDFERDVIEARAALGSPAEQVQMKGAMPKYFTARVHSYDKSTDVAYTGETAISALQNCIAALTK